MPLPCPPNRYERETGTKKRCNMGRERMRINRKKGGKTEARWERNEWETDEKGGERRTQDGRKRDRNISAKPPWKTNSEQAAAPITTCLRGESGSPALLLSLLFFPLPCLSLYFPRPKMNKRMPNTLEKKKLLTAITQSTHQSTIYKQPIHLASYLFFTTTIQNNQSHHL